MALLLGRGTHFSHQFCTQCQIPREREQVRVALRSTEGRQNDQLPRPGLPPSRQHITASNYESGPQGPAAFP